MDTAPESECYRISACAQKLLRSKPHICRIDVCLVSGETNNCARVLAILPQTSGWKFMGDSRESIGTT